MGICGMSDAAEKDNKEYQKATKMTNAKPTPENLYAWVATSSETPQGQYSVFDIHGRIIANCRSKRDAELIAATFNAPRLAEALAESERKRAELVHAATVVLEHVEDEDVKRVNGQCTLCHSYRRILRDALASNANPPEAEGIEQS